jgi:hypothetical protein
VLFPWTAFRDWERFVQYPINVVSYIGVLGITGILAFAGIYPALKKQSVLWMLVTGWFLTPFIGLCASSIIPVSNARFLQGAGYIPAGLLAGLALVTSVRTGVFKNRFIFVTGVVCIILFQIPAFVSSYNRQMMYVEKNLHNPLIMINRKEWEGIEWLAGAGHGTYDETILAPSWISPVLPAFTPMRVYYGHPTFTFLSDEKAATARKVYSNTANQATDIVQTLHPDYIWVPVGVDQTLFERASYTQVFSNAALSLYKRKGNERL